MNIQRLVIIREDGHMSINGRGLQLDLSDMPGDLHAVQWYGDSGHVERTGLMNQPISDLGDFVTWIERWQARAADLDAPPPAPTPEEILAQKKVQRQTAVAAIKVTTAAGNTFDGDEISQGRMARAILGMQTQPGIMIKWVLADNAIALVTADELVEALALAGLEQAAIWSAPYE